MKEYNIKNKNPDLDLSDIFYKILVRLTHIVNVMACTLSPKWQEVWVRILH